MHCVSLVCICGSHFCGVYVLSSATKTQSMIYALEGSAIKTMTPLMGDIGVDHKIKKLADTADQISRKPKTWQIFYREEDRNIPYLALTGNTSQHLCVDDQLLFRILQIKLKTFNMQHRKQSEQEQKAGNGKCLIYQHVRDYSPSVCNTTVSSATSSCACCWNAWKWKIDHSVS